MSQSFPLFISERLLYIGYFFPQALFPESIIYTQLDKKLMALIGKKDV